MQARAFCSRLQVNAWSRVEHTFVACHLHRSSHTLMKRAVPDDSVIVGRQCETSRQQIKRPRHLLCSATQKRVQAINPTKKGTGTDAVVKAAEDKDALWLIVGLGNPGAQYEKTRHNVGFMVVDQLARTEGIDCRKLEKSAAVGRGRINGQQVLLVKPVTFMNNSGEAVSALAKFYKVPMQRILVIADDLDIPHAALKLKPRGGHGGHNGLRSIIERMGNSQEFPRVKIGIGRPAGQLAIATWVLQDFTRREMEDMEVTLHQACDVVRAIMANGLEKTISSMGLSEAGQKQKRESTPPSKAGLDASATAGMQKLSKAVGSTPSPSSSMPVAVTVGART